MEKRNTLLLTVIAIATLLVAVVGATFAYFASSEKVNINEGNVGVSANVGSAQDAQNISFIGAGSGQIALNVTPEMMQQHYAGDGNNTSSNEAIANNLVGSANINVTLNTNETTSTEGYTCYYDLVWTWDDQSDNNSFQDGGWTDKVDGKNIYPSKYYARTQAETWNTGFKEFTLTVEAQSNGYTACQTTEPCAKLNNIDSDTKTTIIAEKNIDEFNALSGDSSKSIVLKSDEYIFARKSEISANYTVTARFYNLNHDQSTLADKKFIGTVSVANVRC